MNKIAIIFPSGHLATTPCITSLAVLLARNNIEVDVYTVTNMTSVESTLNQKNLKLIYYPVKQTAFYENISSLLIGFLPWWSLKMAAKKYDYIIASGIRALIITGLYSMLTLNKNRYIYLSLELYIKREMKTLRQKMFKRLEVYFNKKAAFSIIQDEQRAKILSLENHLKIDSVVIYPNSYVDFGQNSSSGYLRLLNIIELKEKRIALVAGAIFAKWAMTPELIRSVTAWPDNWKLIVHSRAKLSEFEEIMPKDYQISENIVFSREPLSDGEYELLVKAADVGIALYDGKKSENIFYVGYSSGKIAQYLKCGVPIIVSDLPLLKELTDNYNCGVCVNDVSEIPAALAKIESHKAYYSECAKKAYREVFDPELYIDTILSKLTNKLRP